MPRNTSTPLRAHLGSGVLTTATCIRIVRTDGFKIGFSTTDFQFNYTFVTNPDSVGAVTYYSLGGIDPDTVRTTSETSVDNLDAKGILTSDKITEDDLMAGRYDDCDITLFVLNFMDFTMGEMIEFRGTVADLTKADDIWQAELLSQRAKLKRVASDKTCPTCRVLRFGNAQCKYNTGNVTYARSITAVTNALVFTINDTNISGYYNYGWVKCTTGKNAGIEREVKNHVNTSGVSTITLKEVFPFPLTSSDNVLATMGCDHLFSTCSLLSNCNNFRGEPYLPGNDVYTKVGR